MRRPPAPTGRQRGQALVEFSLILIPFLVILMGITDLGRGIYMNNGVAEAAREIARTTVVHPCSASPCTTGAGLGTSAETLATVGVQTLLIPGMTGMNSVQIACTTVSNAPAAGPGCSSGSFVRVTVTVTYSALTPILSMVAPATLAATAHVQVP